MNWIEQFEKKFSDLHYYINQASHTEGEFSVPYMENLESFISTEIIEKLIADIPEHCEACMSEGVPAYCKGAKQQLRDKWL
jgi:hypothetical protein